MAGAGRQGVGDLLLRRWVGSDDVHPGHGGGLGINNASTLEVVAPGWDISVSETRIQGEYYVPRHFPALRIGNNSRPRGRPTPTSERNWGAKGTDTGNEYWWMFNAAAQEVSLAYSHQGGGEENLILAHRYAADAKRFTFGGSGTTQLRTPGEMWLVAAGGSRANLGTLTSPETVSVMDNSLGFFGATPVSKRTAPTGTDAEKIAGLIQLLTDYGLI